MSVLIRTEIKPDRICLSLSGEADRVLLAMLCEGVQSMAELNIVEIDLAGLIPADDFGVRTVLTELLERRAILGKVILS